MATVTHRITTSSTSNTSSYTTGSFSPAVDDLLLVIVNTTGTALDGTVTLSAGGITFTFVDGTPTLLTKLFVADSLVTSATSITATWDCTGDPATGASITVLSVSGMARTGLDAIRQSAVADAGASGVPPTVSFATAALTGNPTIGAVVNSANPSGLTEPSGWAEVADTGYTTPNNGQHVATRNSGFTGTDITWGSNSSTSWRALIAELDTSLPVTTHTKTVVAGAVAQKTLTKTVVAGAALQQTLVKTVVADAVLLKTLVKTAVADAVLLKTLTKTVVVGSMLQQTFTKTVVVDGVLEVNATSTKTVVAGAVLLGTVTKTVATDAVLQKAIAKTVGANAILAGITTVDIAASGFKAAPFGGTLTQTLSNYAHPGGAIVVICATRTTNSTPDTVTVGGIALTARGAAVGNGAASCHVFTHDGITAGTYSVVVNYTGTDMFYACFQVLSLSGTAPAPFGTAVTAANTTSAISRTVTTAAGEIAFSAIAHQNTDAVFTLGAAQTPLSEDQSANGPTTNSRHRIITSYEVGTGSHDMSGNVSPAAGWGTVAFPILEEGNVQTFVRTVVAGSVLLQALTKTVVADADLLKTLTKTVVVDASLESVATSTKAVVAGAVLLQTLAKTVAAGAVLQKTLSRTVVSGGVLQQTRTKTVLGDVVLQQSLSKSVVADGYIESLSQGIKTVGVGAVLLQVGTKTVVVDSRLYTSTQKTVGAGAVIRATGAKTVNANSVLEQSLAKTVLSGAVLQAAGTVSLQVGAVLEVPTSTGTKTVLVGGVVVANMGSLVDVDAVLLQTITSVLFVGAVLGSDTAISLGVSAILAAAEQKTVQAGAHLLLRRARTLGMSGVLVLPAASNPVTMTATLTTQNGVRMSAELTTQNSVRMRATLTSGQGS